MPEVKMDFIPDDMTDDEDEISRASEEIEEFNEYKDKETGEENPNFIYSDEEDFETCEDEVLEPAKSESFIPQAKAKTIQDDIFEEDHDVPPPKPKKERKLTKNGKERKPMSEEHKAKLQQAREKEETARRRGDG